MADGLTVFVANLPFSANEDDVRQTFDACGTVTEFRFPCHADSGKPKGCAIVTFSDNDGLKAAMDLNGTDYQGRDLVVRLDEPKGEGKGKRDKGYGKGKRDFDDRKGKGKGKYGDFDDKGKGKGRKGPSEKPDGCKSVIVKNLSWDTVESTLEALFQDCGTIEGIKIPYHQDTGRSKGFAFIDFDSTEATDEAMKKMDADVDGRQIFVDWSAPRDKGKGKGYGKDK